MSEMVGVIFDTETTDKEPELAKIVQLGVLLDRGADEVPDIIMNALCDPGVPIPPEAQEIHGISNDDLEYAPTDSIAVSSFMQYMRSLRFPVLVGHNINHYDIPVVARVNKEINSWPSIDTFMMARRLYPEFESHKLADVYVTLGGDMDPEGAHDAVYDCILNHHVFRKMLEKTNFTVEEFWQWSMLPTAHSIMPFGKHKGKAMSDVPTGYLRWCKDNFGDVDIDLQKTFDVYLNGGKDEQAN